MPHKHEHANGECGCRCHCDHHSRNMRHMAHEEDCHHKDTAGMTEKELLLKKKEHLENRLKEVDRALDALYNQESEPELESKG